LKLPQPPEATFEAILSMNMWYINYFLCFLIIFNTWFNDHNLFQMVEEIDNNVVFVYGVLILVISVIPYFATWVALNPTSVPAQTMFGLLFLAINFLYAISTYLVVRANPYNEKLGKINVKSFRRYFPVAVILIGFILTYTIYPQAVYISCILATVYSFLLAFLAKSEIETSDRFEAFFDAIVAIVITVLVLEITMASNGSWDALFDLKIEFLAYIISFIVCFNYWNYNHNLFALVNRIDGKVIWIVALAMFFTSLIPYLSHFVANNFNSFMAQACYGIDFMVIVFTSIITSEQLKRVDSANIALLMALKNHIPLYSMIIVVGIGIVIGYLFYPPAVIISCMLSIILVWLIPKLR